ncbi:MAG: hypothetical protein ABGZ53_13010, partial [Fuerstiella sp.]
MLLDRCQYRLWIARILCVITTVFTVPSLLSAQEDDEDFPPGLLAKYSAGEHTIERVDKVLSFDWG